MIISSPLLVGRGSHRGAMNKTLVAPYKQELVDRAVFAAFGL